jgi:N-acyl-D-amino-acid deacylase
MLDYLIINAKIADGKGEMYENALGIEGGKIAFLGWSNAAFPLASADLPSAKNIINAEGLTLVPGIIDIHAHSDSNLNCAEKLLAQGVTTCLSGNCGLSPELDFRAFRAHFERQGYPINQAEQIGHSSLRKACGVQDFYAPASPAQIARMQEMLEQAISDGAAGLSLGLEYDPGAPYEEALALVKTAVQAAKCAGKPPIVSIHARKVDRANDASIMEAIALAEESGARLIVSHLVYMWNGAGLRRALALIDEARRRGVDLWADSGMWTAYATTAGSAVFDEDEFTRKGYDFNKVRAGSGKYAGQFLNLEKYRAERRDSPKTIFIYDPGEPDDVHTALAFADVMVSTDAAPAAAGQGHPQNAATYPRFFHEMVPSVFTLPEALRRTSLLPAQALSLNKGRIMLGADADIAIFDMSRLRGNAGFPGENAESPPDAPPEGVEFIFVNGILSLAAGKRIKGINAGKMI